jgi:hypothetical protein
MTERGRMTGQQRTTWTLVLRLTVLLTSVSSLVVLGGGSALWLIEGEQPGSISTPPAHTIIKSAIKQ